MSDNIRSIGFVPQINRLNLNRKTGDKKNNKDNKKDFSKHMSDSDTDTKGSERNKAREDSENTEQNKQHGENTLHENNENDLDDSCGSLLDAEL